MFTFNFYSESPFDANGSNAISAVVALASISNCINEQKIKILKSYSILFYSRAQTCLWNKIYIIICQLKQTLIISNLNINYVTRISLFLEPPHTYIWRHERSPLVTQCRTFLTSLPLNVWRNLRMTPLSKNRQKSFTIFIIDYHLVPNIVLIMGALASLLKSYVT